MRSSKSAAISLRKRRARSGGESETPGDTDARLNDDVRAGFFDLEPGEREVKPHQFGAPTRSRIPAISVGPALTAQQAPCSSAGDDRADW